MTLSTITPYATHVTYATKLLLTKMNRGMRSKFQYASEQQNVFPLFCYAFASDVDVAVRYSYSLAVFTIQLEYKMLPKLRKLFDSIPNSNAENKWKCKQFEFSAWDFGCDMRLSEWSVECWNAMPFLIIMYDLHFSFVILST